jgi:putative PEP-CTERM system TPR-repeat lipoprotein
MRPIGACAAVAFLLCAPLLAGCDDKSPEKYIQDARADRAAGKISAAIIDVKNALQKDPKNLEARVLLASFYLDLPDPTSAEAELLRARQDGADAVKIAKPLADAELMLGKPQLAMKEAEIADTAPPSLRASLLAVRGLALMATGEMNDAQSVLETALQADPQSIDALSAMARYSLVRRDFAAARQSLAEAQKLDPKSATVLSLQGAVAFTAGEAAESERLFQDMLAVAPWSLSARIGIARAQLAEDKLKEATATLDIVLKSIPNDPNTNYLRAVAAYRQQDYSTAQQHLQKTLGRTNDFPPALMLAGATSYALKQYEQANTYLSQYVYKVPQNVQAKKLLAAAQIAIGRPADAVKTLAPSAQGSEDVQLLAMIGEASARAGDLSSASRYLGQAVEREPDNAALRTQLGVTQVALGQTDTGVEELQKAAEQDPAALRPEIALFTAYMRNKLFDKALEVAGRVEKSHPTAAIGFNLEGFVRAAKTESDDAQKAFLKARELQPGDAIALRMLAFHEVSAHNLPAAAQYLDELLKANPKNTQAYLDLAEVERRENLPDQMQATLQKAIEQGPGVPAPRIQLARLFLMLDKAQNALDTIQPVVTNDPRNGAALETMGRAQLALQKSDEAVTAFKALAELQPQSSVAHRYLAAAYAASKDFDGAISEARKAIEIDPKDVDSNLVLVRIYIAQRDFVSARALLDNMTDKFPNNPSILAIEAEVAIEQGRPDDAVAAFKLALDISDSGMIRARLAAAELAAGHAGEAEKALLPWIDAHADDMSARLGLADIYLKEGRPADAEKQYEIVLAKLPDNVVAENNLAWSLSLLGRTEDALKHARHAAELAPTAPTVLDTLGVVLLQSKNAAEAVTTLQSAAAAAPTSPEIQFHFAQALVQSGDKTRAVSVLKAILTSNQKFADRPQAEQLLAQLGS